MNITKLMRNAICLITALAGIMMCSADYYVATNGTGDGVGSWANATNSLQGAINAAPDGSVVWVSNGIYRAEGNAISLYGSNAVSITKPITLRGWSGNPSDTIIDGEHTNRCLVVNISGAGHLITVEGLTLTNGYGYRRGGGIIVHGDNTSTTIVRNCVISGNITDNPTGDSSAGGGGVFFYPSSDDTGFRLFLVKCVVHGNHAREFAEGTNTYTSYGGGLFLRGSATVTDCSIIGNNASSAGGGIFASVPQTTMSVTLDRCEIRDNVSASNGGGGYFRNPVYVYNALVVSNSCAVNGGGFYVFDHQFLYNCTIVGNTKHGVFFRSSCVGTNFNCVIYYNTPADLSSAAYSTYINCCSSIISGYPGENNIELPPEFVGEGDFRLQTTSPCVNTGTNMPWMNAADALDLDGCRRLDRFSRRVDMGCYEYLLRGTIIELR
ncbi:MAG: hypothetical protein ACOYCD_09240 [Kiritimatiellia bacterium]|jgi:hypothetical protein